MGSLDNIYMDQEKSKQDLLNDQCDLSECKQMYKEGDIDLIEYMERTTKTKEYKNLKENFCE